MQTGPSGMPLCKVAFYDDNGRPTIVEVESLVPQVTAVSNAIGRYPELANRSSSIELLPEKSKVLKIINGRRVVG